MASGMNQRMKTKFFKITGLKDKDPMFSQQEQLSDGRGTTNQVQRVSGKFIGIEQGTYEYEGDTYKTVKIHLQDEDERVIIQSGLTGVMRGTLNTLATAKLHDTIKLSLSIYKGRPSMWIEVNGNKGTRLLSRDEQKALITETEYKGKKLKDYSKVEDKLLAVILKYDSKNLLTQAEDDDNMDSLFAASEAEDKANLEAAEKEVGIANLKAKDQAESLANDLPF